ncbi:MAG: Fic family protein [Betaproteobacteria bacterium]|nr:Fic family protein [Betaproteobacteria bacterium]
MSQIGYARLIAQFDLTVRALRKPAVISTAVNRKVVAEDRVLFPTGVALDDSPLGHLEFALRHEGVNLEVIEAAFAHIEPASLVARLRATPNGDPIRRACFLWEWLTGQTLEADVAPTGSYVDLFPVDEYFTSAMPRRMPRFRVRDNALGTADFCPIVRRISVPTMPDLAELLAEARHTLEATQGSDLYERALQYLYLSETRGSFGIEHESPSADKQARFVELLRHAGEDVRMDENGLVQLQNVIVRDAYSQETSYRTRQNWLEDATGRITFFPPPPEDLRRVMGGWAAFVNDTQRCPDNLVKAACAAFGLVYLHPFMDGNGRLHRFLIHHVLARSGLLGREWLIPVSAVILKRIPAYHAVLSGFSRPVTALWNYQRGDAAPMILRTPGGRPYRFFEADQEVAFLHEMIRLAVQDEIPAELAWLQGYDAAFAMLDADLDLPRKDLSALIRMIHSNGGKLSQNRRRQYSYLPDAVLNRIEVVVGGVFANGKDAC